MMTPNHFTCGWGRRTSSPSFRLGRWSGRFRWVRIIDWLFLRSKAAPWRLPHASSRLAKICSLRLTVFKDLSAVMNATSSINPSDNMSGMPASWERREELYKMTDKGEP